MWINSKNGTVVAGNITQDPEFKLVGQNADKPLFKFSIIMGKDESGQKRYADVAAWGRLAEILRDFGMQKGDPVAVYGLWESRESKGKTYWTLQADYISAYPHRAAFEARDAPISPSTTQSDGIDFGDMPDFMK
jgi:hypothetical protein